MVMSGQSVNLTTLFLGRLRPPKRYLYQFCASSVIILYLFMQTMQLLCKAIVLTLFIYFQQRYFSLSLLCMANRMHVGKKFKDFQLLKVPC